MAHNRINPPFKWIHSDKFVCNLEQRPRFTVVFAAHYDTRHKADKDWNESRQDEPIDGANDGASGVAVLLELARIIPDMNLTHEITLFFTDAEDQGDNHSTYVLGLRHGLKI